MVESDSTIPSPQSIIAQADLTIVKPTILSPLPYPAVPTFQVVVNQITDPGVVQVGHVKPPVQVKPQLQASFTQD